MGMPGNLRLGEWSGAIIARGAATGSRTYAPPFPFRPAAGAPSFPLPPWYNAGRNRTWLGDAVEADPPDLSYEAALWEQGVRYVAGVDEVGRGPIAGPVVAAAVILPPACDFPWLDDVRDSKQLTPRQRERLAAEIRRCAAAVGVGVAPVGAIDRHGIAPALRSAMLHALASLRCRPQWLLTDAVALPEAGTPQHNLIGGDRRSCSIAAASIVAKVARDRIMEGLDHRFSGYGLARNKGYCTAEHVAALLRLGPSPVHRRSFAPVRQLVGG